MNRREAGYVRHLIDHLLTPGSVDADDMEEAVVVLAALAHDVLGTGPDGPAVALLWEQSQQRDPTWTVAPADPPDGGAWKIRCGGHLVASLGDSVTASTDGYHLVLTADGAKDVWLDPGVFRALLRYAASIDFSGLEG